MGVVEDFPLDAGDSADPACRCGCALWDHLEVDEGPCVCGCPGYRPGPARPEAAAGDQAVA